MSSKRASQDGQNALDYASNVRDLANVLSSQGRTYERRATAGASLVFRPPILHIVHFVTDSCSLIPQARLLDFAILAQAQIIQIRLG